MTTAPGSGIAAKAIAAALLLPAMMVAVALTAVAGAGGQPPAGACGPAGTAQAISGADLDAEQMGNAQTIVSVTAARPLPAYAAVVALAAAYTESGLRNTATQTDHDSEGLFQQRVSIYTEPVAIDPARATGAFLDRLVQVPGWETGAVGADAQAVQISAYPGRYEPNAPMARELTGMLWPLAAASSPAIQLGPPICPGGGGALPPGAAGTATTGSNVAGTTSIPAGLTVAGTEAGRAAVEFALAQLGKPYVFGAAGPDAFDCSGLVMAAWASAGTALPHLASAQASMGSPEPLDLSQAAAGDLVFIAGSDGTAEEPGHVGMVGGHVDSAGNRRLYLVQAPMTGIPVELTDAAEWAGQIVAVRRIA